MKKVGRCYYVHKSNIKELLAVLSKEEQLRLIELLNSVSHDYEIIKYNLGVISLIECEEWDTVQEPLVGDSHLYKPDGTVKLIKGGRTVYHCKECFVSDDYQGFDLEAAKARTKEWNAIPGIKDVKSKIGNQKFWHNYLLEHGLSI